MSKPAVTPEKPTDAPAPRKLPHLALNLDALPVDFLKFPAGGYPDLPGKSSASSVTANPDKPINRPYHAIDFIPALHAFAVYFIRPSEPMQMVYVPSDRVLSWGPSQ